MFKQQIFLNNFVTAFQINNELGCQGNISC